MSNLHLDLARHALATAQDHGFAEVEVSSSEGSFKAILQPGARPKLAAASREQARSEAATPELAAIKSALVGFYHAGPTPLELGKRIKRGDVVGVINALGIANDVEATVEGEIVEVVVHDGQAVEFGQTLAKVKA